MSFDLIWFDLLCLTPLSAIFQPYHGVQLKPEYPERNTDLGQATGNHYHLRVECTLFCNLQSRARTHAALVAFCEHSDFPCNVKQASQFTMLTLTATRNYGEVNISCSINGSQSSMFKASDNTFIFGNMSVITSRTFSINQQSIMVTVQFLKKRLRISFVRNPNVWLSELAWHWRLGLLLLKKGKRIIRKYISHSYM